MKSGPQDSNVTAVGFLHELGDDATDEGKDLYEERLSVVDVYQDLVSVM